MGTLPEGTTFHFGRVHSIGGIALAFFLILFAAKALVPSLEIPNWPLGCLGLAAGILILVGR